MFQSFEFYDQEEPQEFKNFLEIFFGTAVLPINMLDFGTITQKGAQRLLDGEQYEPFSNLSLQQFIDLLDNKTLNEKIVVDISQMIDISTDDYLMKLRLPDNQQYVMSDIDCVYTANPLQLMSLPFYATQFFEGVEETSSNQTSDKRVAKRTSVSIPDDEASPEMTNFYAKVDETKISESKGNINNMEFTDLVIENQWKKFGYYKYLTALLYCPYGVLLAMHCGRIDDKGSVTDQEQDKILVIPTFIGAIILTYIEAFQCSKAKSIAKYFLDFKNTLDFTGLLTYLFFGTMVLFGPSSDDYKTTKVYLVTFAIITGVLRGLMSLLSLHRSTRFVTHIMILITWECIPFLLVYLSGIIYFIAVFFQTDKLGETFTGVSEKDNDFTDMDIGPLRGFFAIWNLGLGSMEYKFKTYFGASTYVVATLLQVIISLNLLISVVGDHYDHMMG